jgi:hypothetical protein
MRRAASQIPRLEHACEQLAQGLEASKRSSFDGILRDQDCGCYDDHRESACSSSCDHFWSGRADPRRG